MTGSQRQAPGFSSAASQATGEPTTESVADKEPDYRFTLANERTFLAWIRTALALLAAGVAVGELFSPDGEDARHAVLAAVCVLVATTLSLGAFYRWGQVQSAMRRSAPLPSATIVRITIVGVCVIAIVCTFVVLS